MIWEALKDATPGQLNDLKTDWDADGELKKLVTGKWTISAAETKRFEAILRQGTSMTDRLLQVGIDVHDTQGVIQAALKTDGVKQSFIAEYPKHEDFWRDFTGNGTIGAAMLWGDKLVSTDWHERLRLAVEMRSDEGVRDVLVTLVKTDADRAAVRADEQLMAAMHDMNWSTIEPLTAPVDDLQARSVWLGQRFEREKGMWGSSRPATAFGDEKRELDAALATAVDPAHLTPEERKRIAPVAASTEAALSDFIQVRDQLDAIAIQVVGVAAGLIATALTGGGAGPLVAGVLARTALAQGCAAVAAVWVVKQERTTGAEAVRAFVVGAASGATGAMTGSALRPLATDVTEVATNVATQQFSGVGQQTMNAAIEGLAANTVGSTIDTASRAETWRNGFVQGLGNTLDAAVVGGVQGALTGAAAHLFSEAVQFARDGKVREANEKMNALEGQLPPEQAAELRRALNDEMKSTLGKPPGRGEPTPEQQSALEASRTVADGNSLTPAEFAAEQQVVAKSEPQPSTVDGYLDEVDLGNGHAWRRKADGSWCRFSTPSRCGTEIPNAPAPSPQTRSRGVRATLTKLESDLDVLRSHPDVLEMAAEATAIGRLLDAGDIDNNVVGRLQALRRKVDLGLGTVAEGGLNNKSLGGEDDGHTTTITPTTPTNTGPPVALDTNSPPASDPIGQQLLKHVRDAIAKFADDGYSQGQLAALRDNPGLASAFRGSRIDEFAKLAVGKDPDLAHVISTGLYEPGADFYDSRTGRWYDITTAQAWKAHVAKYGASGSRLPTEVK
jgi:hypothetical protein